MVYDEKLGREKIIAEAETWIKTPFRTGARVKGAGVDCGLLIAEIYRNCGMIASIDPGAYKIGQSTANSSDVMLEKYTEMFFDEVDREPLPGDVIMYQFGLRKHVALITNFPEIIHANPSHGVIYDDDRRMPQEGKKVFCLKEWR